MTQPRLIVTGASGFIGRHFLDAVKDQTRIFALARRSQVQCGAPFHDNISWHQVDIAEREPLAAVFDSIRRAGGSDTVIHLAAHYDFTGEEDPEYWRTNVDGLRNMLEECVQHRVRRFIFASSVAACDFPPRGTALTEVSPPDGDHIYARSKKVGEEMLAEYDGLLQAAIVRFAALFSDWCEYPPLYFFLSAWLSEAWNSRVLGGQGLSAIPYLHVRDAVIFLRRVVARFDSLEHREVLQASPDGATNHVQLYNLANLSFRSYRRRPVFMPHFLCRVGVWARDLVGRVLGDRPFERPWMVRYIDQSLSIDASRSRQRLSWKPRERLLIERRVPFMVENLKTEPVEWQRRNRAAMKEVRVRANLRIHRLLEKHSDRIGRELIRSQTGSRGARLFPSYQSVTGDILHWRYQVVMRHLMNAVRTGDKGVFKSYCRDLAERRHKEGFAAAEVCGVLETLNNISLRRLREDSEGEGLDGALEDHITMTIRFGADQVYETFDQIEGDL